MLVWWLNQNYNKLFLKKEIKMVLPNFEKEKFPFFNNTKLYLDFEIMQNLWNKL
jgi:hypothetical protein